MINYWVIGGDSGIGQKVAYDLVIQNGREGWVHATGREVDVRSTDAIYDFMSTFEPHAKEIRVVYSAGINQLGWIKDTVTAEQMLEQYEVNVVGFVRMLRAVSHLYERGRVVAISSDAGIRPLRTSIGYCASKAALDMAVKVAAREMAPAWQINAVAPGIIGHTPMTDSVDEQVGHLRGWSSDFALKYERSQIPAGRRGTKEEISKVVRAVLDGPEYLTGAIIPVNGGR